MIRKVPKAKPFTEKDTDFVGVQLHLGDKVLYSGRGGFMCMYAVAKGQFGQVILAKNKEFVEDCAKLLDEYGDLSKVRNFGCFTLSEVENVVKYDWPDDYYMCTGPIHVELAED